jgi:hypothetical protein
MSDRHTLGDAPIEAKHREMMNGVAKGLDDVFNGELRGKRRKVGWCLMVFDFGQGPGRANYISNADRNDVVVLLREQLARFEGMPEQEGRA